MTCSFLYLGATFPLAIFGMFSVSWTPPHVLTAGTSPLPKVRWFNRLPSLKEKKHQATSDNYQNGNNPNQFNRHPLPLSPPLIRPLNVSTPLVHDQTHGESAQEKTKWRR